MSYSQEYCSRSLQIQPSYPTYPDHSEAHNPRKRPFSDFLSTVLRKSVSPPPSTTAPTPPGRVPLPESRLVSNPGPAQAAQPKLKRLTSRVAPSSNFYDLSRFLSSLGNDASRSRAGLVIHHRRHLEKWDSEWDVNITKDPFSTTFLKINSGVRYIVTSIHLQYINLIISTIHLHPTKRKAKITETITANHFADRAPFHWGNFQRNMRLIDCLYAPDKFGEAVLGLTLLFPHPFEWFKRGNVTRMSGEKMEAVVRAALTEKPDLLPLAQELLPYAKWIMDQGEALPVLKGVEDRERVILVAEDISNA